MPTHRLSVTPRPWPSLPRKRQFLLVCVLSLVLAVPGTALGAEQYWNGTGKTLNAGDVWTINADSTVERTHDVNLTGALTINGDATDGGILNIGSNGVLRTLGGATLSTTGTINVGGVLDLSYGQNNLGTVYTAAATASDGTTLLPHLTDGADAAYSGGKIALGSGAVLKMPGLVIVDNNTATPGLSIASDATIKTDSLVLTPADADADNSFAVNAGNLVLNGAAASLVVNGAANPGALNLHGAAASPATLILGDADLSATPTGTVHGDVNVGATSAYGRLEAAAGTWRVTGNVAVANGSSLSMGEAGGVSLDIGGNLENGGTITGSEDAATHLTVDGLLTSSGSLTLNNSGSVLAINGAGGSVNSGVIADNGALVLGSGAGLSNIGQLTVGSDDTATGVTMGSGAALTNSGTATIYGDIAAATDADGKYLGSQSIANTSSLTVSGATILGANAVIANTPTSPASDAALTLKSDLTLGSGAAFTNSGYYDDGTNTFQSVAAISGDVSAASAVISNENGAQLDISGTLDLGEASTFENAAADGTLPAAQATLGGLNAGAGTTVANKGNMTVNGAVSLTGADGDAATLNNTGALTITGTTTLHRYSVFDNAGTADMNGNVTASAPSLGDTASTVVLGNSGKLNMNSGTLDLSHVTSADQTGSGVINIMGGAALLAGSDQLAGLVDDNGAGDTPRIVVSGTSSIPGTIRLTDGAAELSSDLLAAVPTDNKIALAAHSGLVGADLTLNGDAIAIDSDASITADNLSLIPGDTGVNTVTVNSGKLFLTGTDGTEENASGSTLKTGYTNAGGAFVSGTLVLGGDTAAGNTASLFLGDTSLAGSASLKGTLTGVITVGDASSAGDTGALTVAAGVWTLENDLTVADNGALSIGGQTAEGHAGSIPAVLDASAGLTLEAGADAVVNDGGALIADDNTLTVASSAKINTASGGEVQINGASDMTATAANKYRTDRMKGAGLLNLGSTYINDLSFTDENGNALTSHDAIQAATGNVYVDYKQDPMRTFNVTNDDLAKSTVTNVGDENWLTGRYRGVRLADGATEVRVGSGDKTLQLTGDGGKIIANADGTAAGNVTVLPKANLILGARDAANGGEVGDINLQSTDASHDSSLRILGNDAANVLFSTGAISAKAEGTLPTAGAISVTGATLNAAGIGDAVTSVTSVTADGGNVFVPGTIDTATSLVTITPGEIFSGTIEAANGGTVRAGGVTDGTETYTAGGNISADAIIAASGGTVVAVAGNDGSGLIAGTGDIDSKSITVTGSDSAVAAGNDITTDSLALAGTDADNKSRVTAGGALAISSDLTSGYGEIIAAGAITTETLSADNRTSITGADITVTEYAASARLVGGSSLTATAGDVSLAGGLTDGNGVITAENGNIVAHGIDPGSSPAVEIDKNLQQADGGALSLHAVQGAIRAANITATNIAARTLAASGDVTVENGGTLLLTGRDLSASGGANDSSSIAGMLVVNNTNTDKSNPGTLGDITVQGNTSITGSNLAGNAVVLNGADNSIAASSLAADSLDVDGALRTTQSSASVTGDFSAKALAANNSTIIADSDHDGSGDAVIAAPITEFADSSLQGANVYLAGEGSDTTAASGITGSITATSGDIVAYGPDTGSPATPVYKDILQGDGKLSLSAVNGGIKAANITATSIRAKQLTAQGDVALTGDGSLVLTGTASQGAGSTVTGDLALTDTASQVADLTVHGKTVIDGGSLKSFANNGNVDTLTLEGGGVIKNGAAVNVEKLVLGDGQTLAVGSQKDAKGGTSLRAGTLSLNDGVLTAEGVWGKSPTVVAADFASDGKGNRIVDGDVAVGRNAKVTLGSSDPTWLNNKVNGALSGGALSPTGTSAVLGIANPVKLGATASGTAGIMVDGSQTGADAAQGIVDNHVVIRDNSLLVVNAAAADTLTSSDGALSSATPGATATVADRANIRITDAKALRTYTVFGTNFDNVKNNVNATTDTPLLSLTRTGDGKSYTSNVVPPETVYPDISGEMGDIIRKGLLLDQIGPSHVNDSEGGRRFLSRVIDSRYIGDDKRAAVRTMESARDMVGVAGVDEMLWAAHNAAGAAVTQRTSLVAPSGNMQTMQADGTVATGVSSGDPTGMGGSYDNSGFAMWVMPLYQSYNAWGIEGSGGNLDRDFNGRLGGVALGADYTFDNSLRAGVNFNIGAGYGEGKGDYSKTTNNMNFWGLGAYAGVTRENFGLAADVNFTSTYNKLKQDLPGGMHMSDLKADVTARAISAGLRGEYKIATGVADIVPHGGVRYTNLHIDGYDAKSNGTVVKGEAINQNIWTFPVGVALRRRMDLENGWWLKPGVDVGVTPAAGQIKGNADIRFSGVSGRAETVVQPLDHMTYYGQAGLEVGNEDLALGVNYNLQVGQHHTNHSLFGTFRVDF